MLWRGFERRTIRKKGECMVFGMVGLENISGGDFFEVLQSLVSVCVPDGKAAAKILSDYSVLFLILGIAVGISQCFFGYKLRKIWTAVLMIILGGLAGAAIATGFSLPVAALVGITAAMAVIGGLFGYFLWITGCFLRPLASVSVVVFSLFVVYDLQTLGLIIGLAAGLIVGILAAAFYRIGLLLYTAVFGGLLAGQCIWELTGIALWYPALIIGGILVLAGFGVQMFANWKPREATSGKDAVIDPDAAGFQAEIAAETAAAKDTADTDSVWASGSAGASGAAGAEARQGFAGSEDSGLDGKNPLSYGTGAVPDSSVTLSGGVDNNTTNQSPAPETAGVCPSCGTPYSARAKFCMQCGCKL